MQFYFTCFKVLKLSYKSELIKTNLYHTVIKLFKSATKLRLNPAKQRLNNISLTLFLIYAHTDSLHLPRISKSSHLLMKLFSRFIFLLLAVFFASPLARENAQYFLKESLTQAQVVQSPDESSKASEKIFFCEQEEVVDNDSDDTDDDNIFSDYNALSSHDFCLGISNNNFSQSRSAALQNSEKLFLLFHSLKLDC